MTVSPSGLIRPRTAWVGGSSGLFYNKLCCKIPLAGQMAKEKEHVMLLRVGTNTKTVSKLRIRPKTVW